MAAGQLWGAAMVLSNVCLLPLDRSIYGTEVGTLSDGSKERFQRPFLAEFVMFLAMACCILLELPIRRRARSTTPLLPARGSALRLLAPALCDLFGSWFIFTGALWVPASVVEMLGCSNVVFTAFLSKVLLKKVLQRHEVVGVAILCVGLLVVGVARLAAGAGSDSGARPPAWAVPLGLLFVLLAHLWYAAEFVVTEKVLGEANISAFVSVGVMGMWGAAIFVLLFPLLALTPSEPLAMAPAWHEEVFRSLGQAAARPGLAAQLGTLWLMLMLFNAAAFKTTEQLSALARVVIAQLVSPLVWLLDLAVARVSESGAGERWTAWSGLQLLGFGLLLSGTLVYNGVVPLPARGGVAREAGLSLVEASRG